jgi:hypothetical protein
MSATEESLAEPETESKRDTKYTVLKQMELTPDGANATIKTWLVVAQNVLAQNSQSAIKLVAIDDAEVHEGTYVAVPNVSFKPKVVKQVVQLTME